jgi:hypothetical protein
MRQVAAVCEFNEIRMFYEDGRRVALEETV